MTVFGLYIIRKDTHIFYSKTIAGDVSVQLVNHIHLILFPQQPTGGIASDILYRFDDFTVLISLPHYYRDFHTYPAYL